MVCPICSNADAKIKNHHIRDSINVDCKQCGTFAISNTAVALLTSATNFASDRWKISAWVNEIKPEFITSTELETASTCATPSLHQRAEKMLRLFLKICPPGEAIYAEDFGNQLMSAGWNQSPSEAYYMLGAVLSDELGLITKVDKFRYGISAKGLLYLEGRREAVSSVGFCAMWFSDKVLPLWKEVIEPAITAAGYEALRIDSKQHNGKIDDEIMASIRASKFVVSDFTGNRGGVYYEAGSMKNSTRRCCLTYFRGHFMPLAGVLII